MNKVYAGIASVGVLVLGSISACSSADTPDGSGGTASSSSGTSSAAGTTATPSGGTGNASAGSTSSTAGMTTTPTAGTASTSGGTGGGVVDPACKGIKTGVACTAEGVDCQNLACGLADSGVRSCKCQSTWMCASCDYSASPFKDKPATVPACAGIEADKVTCTEADKGKVCTSASGEICACWTDDEGSLIWDCDKAPTTWAAPTM